MRNLCNARIALFAAVVVVSAGSASAADVAPRPSAGCSVAAIEKGRELHRGIDVNGTRRAYILDVPESVQAQHAAPLLFDFHGFGHSAAGVWQVSKFSLFTESSG